MMKVFYDDVNLLKIESDDPVESLSFGKVISNSSNGCLVEIEKLDLSKKLSIMINNKEYEIIPRGITHTTWFEEAFDAWDVRLGANVENGITYFNVYAPTRYSVSVRIGDSEYPMSRLNNGVYHFEINKNLHGESYVYVVNNELVTTDPYAKASLPNRKASVVVDFEKLDLTIGDFKFEGNPVILETHIRDFSMDPKVPFKNRGKFLGMLESYGNYGFNHILDLGITHVQLMPVNDFETVDELNPYKMYNWGYDPMQFMVLEGSYSSNVLDPMQVLKDFSKLVDTYHKHGIGINLDVVFNHVYDVESHPFHVLVPYYYFRYDENYNLSNGSFCGNELASERKMVRKLILDTIDYFVEVFRVDGFRFDLMGLLDVETMNLVNQRDVWIYGEGWKMPTIMENHKQAHMFNQDKMRGIGHFNDRFRDTIAGDLNTDDVGFASGVVSDQVMAALYGNSNEAFDQYLFDNWYKSINYVECHDNLTLADKVKEVDIAKFLTGVTILSRGIPLIQIGQSFFRSKSNDDNSYKSGDEINMIRWNFLDRYEEFNEFVKRCIQWRKSIDYNQFMVKKTEDSVVIGSKDVFYKIDGKKLVISEHVF